MCLHRGRSYVASLLVWSFCQKGFSCSGQTAANLTCAAVFLCLISGAVVHICFVIFVLS